jgi:hypothetical protein
MTKRTATITTVSVLAVLLGLTAADYLITGKTLPARLSLTGIEDIPAGAVAKGAGPDVTMTIAAAGMETSDTDEATFLEQIADSGVRSVILLKDGDRAGSVAWLDSADVKTDFMALKDGLLESFSPDLKDLKDVTEQEPGRPVRNILSFSDSALSEDRLVFIRVRERLFEFHITAGSEDAMNSLIEALTTK